MLNALSRANPANASRCSAGSRFGSSINSGIRSRRASEAKNTSISRCGHPARHSVTSIASYSTGRRRTRCRDRGTLIAGAGIGLAFLIAGVGYLFFLRQEQATQHAEEARAWAEEEQQHAEAIQKQGRRFEKAIARSPGEAIAAGADWLIQQQSPDGAWRSDTYATFKSGTALTPQVVVALQAVKKPGGRDPIRTGCESIAKLVKPDGSIEGAEGELDFPVYTAALSVIALSHPDQKHHVKARDAWLKFLLSHQLTEQNGWKPEAKPYGGWGYCRLVPKKPEPGGFAPPLVESNLSATVFALDALNAAGVKEREVYRQGAETFLKSCQNADGGFHFIYDDPVRNKAGMSDGRFQSYGTATADGVRGLQICEAIRMKHEDEAAKVKPVRDKLPSKLGIEWLEKHYRDDKHPGFYIPAHEPNRDAVYYYYAASVSRLLRAEWTKRVNVIAGQPALAAELASRQKPDGSWANSANLVREDEPLVATTHALIAIANCSIK